MWGVGLALGGTTGYAIASLPNMLGVAPNLRLSNILSTEWLLMVLALSLAAPLFIMIAFLFVPFGQSISWYVENSTTGLSSYTVNVGASFLVILAFTLASFLNAAPVAWLLVLGFFLLWLFWKRTQLCLACVAGLLICTGCDRA